MRGLPLQEAPSKLSALQTCPQLLTSCPAHRVLLEAFYTPAVSCPFLLVLPFPPGALFLCLANTLEDSVTDTPPF